MLTTTICSAASGLRACSFMTGYSLQRYSGLDPDECLDQYFDTGAEHTGQYDDSR
jgi:hypothetical protein